MALQNHTEVSGSLESNLTMGETERDRQAETEMDRETVMDRDR